MGWHCHHCDISNKAAAEYCESCRGHWGSVWIRQDRRSKSKQKKENKRDKKDREAKEAKEQSAKTDEGEMDWQIFPTKVPWVVSTPQARLSMPKSTEREVIADIPPPPTLQPPPSAPAQAPKPAASMLSQAEQQLVKHLRGIRELSNEELPPQLLQQLQDLETKEKEQQIQKPLTHSHINRLHKLQSQANSQLARITNLDTEWKAFLEKVQQRIAVHVSMYRSCRASHVSNYHAKLQELEEAKQNVSTASRSLVEQSPAPGTVPTAPDPDQQAFAIQQELQFTMASVEQILSDGDTLEEMELENAPEGADGKSHKPRSAVTIGAFRHSPGRVAQHQLKQARAKEHTGPKEKGT